MTNIEKKNCKYCNSEISKVAKVCPNCQKDLRNWFVKHYILSFILIIIVIGGIFGGDVEENNNKEFKKVEFKNEIKKQNIKIEEKKDNLSKGILKGIYNNYKYTINNKNGINIAMFEPFLEKNDNLVFGAIKKVANDFYKNIKFENINPKVETLKTGKNALVLETINDKYYFLIFKNETGKVFGFSFWKKIKLKDKKNINNQENIKNINENQEKKKLLEETNIIKENCNKKWGNDFRMIKYCINQQTENRIKFYRGNISGIKDNIFMKIRRGCIKKWGNDFRMRIYCEGQQIKSYKDLQKM